MGDTRVNGKKVGWTSIDTIPDTIIAWAIAKAPAIYQGPKSRGRSLLQVFNDCVFGKCLEGNAANTYNLIFNPKVENPDDPSSYDHDLVDPITKETYEVKQARLDETNRFGKTLVFHKDIFDIAKKRERNFDFFIFGKTESVDLTSGISKSTILAKIPRDAIIKFSQPSTRDTNYMYFQDGKAYNHGQPFELCFKG